MANDIFVLVTPDFANAGVAKDIQGVVLPSKKTLGRDKDFLKIQVDEAQQYWQEDGNSGDIPTDVLYRYLSQMNMSAYRAGWVLPVDEARELVKKSGGL